MVLRYWFVINYPGFSLYLYRIVSGSGYVRHEENDAAEVGGAVLSVN